MLRFRKVINGLMVTWLTILSFMLPVYGVSQNALSHLQKNGNHTQLIVDGKPFLILGGETGNSSASSAVYMRSIWPKVKQMHLNTLLVPVYWELVEPEEGRFDFSLLDTLISGASANNMKLVLLWFGAWKNSMSCYAPAWVKANTSRFPRTFDRSGKAHEILTPFSRNNLEADKRAFVQMMQYLKKTDAHHTVIAVQVENEIGMLPDARSYDAAANQFFQQQVPSEFISYLSHNRASLLPELKTHWQANGGKTSGSWEDIFGKSLFTDEIFMSWYYARFVEDLATAGKGIHPLPMFVNAALNRQGVKPGDYPSAGPLPHVMDVWKAAAPSIDLLTPDFYNPDFKKWCELYTRAGDPLLIPEIRFEHGIDAKAFFAFGNYNCLGFSPFSIESTDQPEQESIGKAYQILQQLAPLIALHQPTGNTRGFMLSKDSALSLFMIGRYRVTVQHEYTLGWSAGAKKSEWPLAGGLIIALNNDEFFVAGTGLVITFEAVEPNKKAGLLTVDEGTFVKGKWTPGRRLNGDQTHQGRHIRIPGLEYDIQHVRLYTY